MATWNPNDHCFDWKRLCFGGFFRPKIEDKLVPVIDFGSTPHAVTVTTRIITFFVGNPYKLHL